MLKINRQAQIIASRWEAVSYAAEEEIKKENLTLWQALSILEGDKPHNFRFDLHSVNNVMQRKDGTIVLSDPYAVGNM